MTITQKRQYVHKYIEHDPSKPTTISMREKGTDKYENANTQVVAIEFSRRREREPTTLRTFCRLQVCAHKRAKQSRQRHIHSYIIGYYNSSVRIIDLVSHTTYIVCI